MSFSPFAQKRMLDFVCGGASATEPAARWAGLLDVSGSEISATGYARVSALFNAASSPGGYASMAPTTFQPFTSNGTLTVVAVGVWDNSVGTNLLLSGVLSNTIVVRPNAGVVIAALSISLF